MANRNTNERIENTAEAAADEGGRPARAVTDETARVAEQTARASADVARRGAETAREAVHTTLDTANEAFRRVTDQFTNVLGFNGPQAEEVARRSSRTIQAVAEASTVLVRGAQEISHELLGQFQDSVRKNAEAVNRIASVRSV